MLNRFRVCAVGIGPSKCVHFTVCGRSVELSVEHALELATWIIATTDPDEKRFDEILRQIEEG